MTARIFARIFDTTKGQILLEATVENDLPAIRCVVDTHPGQLSPAAVTFSFEDGCEFERLATYTQETAEKQAAAIYNQVEAMLTGECHDSQSHA